MFTASRMADERPFLTVVIPTRDRWQTLKKCLGHLARQDYPHTRYEVVVVDDGSSDGSAGGVELMRTGDGPLLRCLRRSSLGPAAARNAGVREAEGDVILFLGDDIMASPGLVAQHARYHEANPEPHEAALGFVTWSPTLRITPFMQWLERGGPQFAYGSLHDEGNVSPGHFYTANVSVKRAFLLRWGLFDESLRHAAFEDFDLGRRLGERGLRLVLIADAVGYHLHPTTVSDACCRMLRLGEAAVALRKKYPELVWVEPDEPTRRRLRRRLLLSDWCLAASRAAARVLQHLSCTPHGLYRLVLDAHFRRAVRDSLDASTAVAQAPDGQ